ncbi:MAG: hypothetical protein ABL919_08550 [Methylococcales bacterium]|nr:hypothetical protein [Methylococcaceae bacterium]
MALTPIPTNTPLTQLRQQGLDAVFSRCRVCVFPRHKITNSIAAFVTNNLEAIANELNQEGYYTKNNDPLGYLDNQSRNLKLTGGYLIWSVDNATRSALGGQAVDFRDVFTDDVNGFLYQ